METHVSVCNGRRPFWMNTTFLYLSTFCFMGWPYRLLFYWTTGKTTYEFKKEFFVNLQDDSSAQDFSDIIPPDNNAPIIINYNIINTPTNLGMERQPTGNDLLSNPPMNPRMNPGINLGINPGINLGMNPPRNSGMEPQPTAPPINPGMELQTTDNDSPWQKPVMELQQEKNNLEIQPPSYSSSKIGDEQDGKNKISLLEV